MITINNLKEIEKYKTSVEKCNKNGIKNIITYEFKENGKLADIEFNVEVPFGTNDLSKCLNEEDCTEPLDLEFSDFDFYSFIAKDVIANKKFRVASLQANNFIFNDDCDILNNLQVENNIQGTNLNCEMGKVYCNNIECEKIFAESILCKGKVFCKELECGKISADKITCI